MQESMLLLQCQHFCTCILPNLSRDTMYCCIFLGKISDTAWQWIFRYVWLSDLCTVQKIHCALLYYWSQ